MSTPLNRHFIGRALAAIAALATIAAAQAQTPASMLGDWKGQGTSAVDAHSINPCWDIERVQGRLLQGHLTITAIREIDPCWFSFNALMLGDGSVFGSGRHEDHIILFSGKTRAFGDGSVRLTGLAYLVLNLRGQPLDFGAMAVMQMMGGPNWDHMAGFPVNGAWDGTFVSRVGPGGGCLEASLANVMAGGRENPTPTTGIEGSMMLQHAFFPSRNSFFDLPFGVQGTNAPPEPERPSSVGMIGLQAPPDPDMPQGIIAILIGLVAPPEGDRPATMTGNYRLYASVFDLFAEITRGGNHSFDGGAFNLPAVQ